MALHGAKVRTPADLARWARYRREAWALWRLYVARERPQLRGPAPRPPARSRRIVVLVELREHPDLDFVLRKSLRELEAGAWALLVVCGPANEAYVRRAVGPFGPGVRLWRLEQRDLDGAAYAALRRSEALLREIRALGGEVVLFLECDAVLLRPGAERFLEYELVGAPWSWALAAPGPPGCVGNGGLCLRSVAFMRRALQHMGAGPEGAVGPPWPERNEDICFARAAAELGARVPSAEQAATFSVETIFHPSPVGCHKPWQYLLPSDLRRLFGLEAQGGWEACE